jgi:UDP-glucose 4-epimerase
MSKYLVTGVAGFIGSAIAKRLLNEGHKVVGMDNLSTGRLDHIPQGVEFYEIGVHQIKVLKILKSHNFDAIFHIAGQSGGELSYADPVYDLQSNSQSTLLLLKYASESGCKKVIYAGTVSVYGDPKNPLEILESEEARPQAFYGVSKLASEHYLRIYAEQYGLDTVSLRLFNIYGPGQNLDNLQQGMTSIYLSQAIRSRHVHVKGSKDRFRDLVYIDDTVDAFVTLLSSKFKGYNCYNICTGKPTTVKEIINETKKNLPFDISVRYEGSTPGDIFGYTGSPSKFMSASSWKPVTNFKDGIKIMIKWVFEEETKNLK